jgi:hypothetical protein
MPNTYDVGDQVRVTATFTSLTGALTDATAVCTVKHPDGTLTTPAVTHGTTGVYTADIPIDAQGAWWYRFVGTGAVIAASEETFFVRTRVVV